MAVHYIPSAMEPMFPEPVGLEDLAVEVIRKSAALEGRLHAIPRRSVVELLRTINGYYSNLIEGHATHPVDIERAMRNDYSADPAKRALQLEGRAHVEVDRLIDGCLRSEPGLNVCDAAFLKWIHAEFYRRMPEEFSVVDARAANRALRLAGGELRDQDVVAARHVAPAHDAIPEFLERFSEVYEPGRLTETRKVLAFAASHHRLLWIHPFLDGNGRVARLFSSAYARRARIDGHGLWTVSRALARRRDEYMAALAGADSERSNDYDGRGNLSLRALGEFCRFFLETCLDQIEFMAGMLEPDGLAGRITGYVELRGHGIVPDRDHLRPEAGRLLVEALHHGEVERGAAARVTGLGTRTARSLVSKLIAEELLYSETPKGPLRLGLPMDAVSYYFPRLYSDEVGLAPA